MVRCPKCHAKGGDVALIERWAGDEMSYVQNDDGSIDPKGFLYQNSDPAGVSGLCGKCSHKWRLRGIFQITNLPGHPDHEKYERNIVGKP